MPLLQRKKAKGGIGIHLNLGAQAFCDENKLASPISP
ncbi:hypothetical protein VIF_002955 [Vibrio cholerae TM 11079-80]|nr:hypothetical protein VIF_002955 [Vibrio cholerae TM 11079-80]